MFLIRQPRRYASRPTPVLVEFLESRQLLTVTASNSFGLSPGNAIDVPANPANDFFIHNFTLTINNDAGVASSIVNGVTTATINSSALTPGNPSTATINLSGTVVGPTGYTVLPHTLIVHVEINGIDTSDITSTSNIRYDSTTKRDTVSYSGSVHVPAGTSTANIGLVMENTQTHQSTPLIPFFAVNVDTSLPTVTSVGPVSGPFTAPIDSVPVTFSKPIIASSFTAADISLTRNGAPVALSGLTITPSSGSAANFTISGLAPFTGVNANYVVSVSSSGVRDASNNVGNGSVQQTSFTIAIPPLVTVQVAHFTTIKITTGTGKKAKTTSQQVLQIQFSAPLNGVANLAAYQLLGPKTVKVKGKSTTTYSTPITFKSVMTAQGPGGALIVNLVPKSTLNTKQHDQLTIIAPAFLDSLGRPLQGNQGGSTGGNYVVII